MTPAQNQVLDNITWPEALVASTDGGYLAKVTWDGRTVRDRTALPFPSRQEALAWAEKERDDLHRLYGPMVLRVDELEATLSFATGLVEAFEDLVRELERLDAPVRLVMEARRLRLLTESNVDGWDACVLHDLDESQLVVDAQQSRIEEPVVEHESTELSAECEAYYGRVETIEPKRFVGVA